jgi:hypothetical protein
MKNISFDRDISQLQVLKHYSLRHHALCQHHDYHYYYNTNGGDVNGDDYGILFIYGLLICSPKTICGYQTRSRLICKVKREELYA